MIVCSSVRDTIHTAYTGPGAPFCAGRFRNVGQSSNAVPAISTLARRLSVTISAAAICHEVDDWQLVASAHMLAGKDCFIITATGSGKTFCYQSVLLHNSDAIMVVICPLITLMEDQVASAAKLGIPAIALHADNLLNSPDLVTKVANGAYRLVLVGPEFCVPGNRHWMGLTVDCAFSQRLIGITIDEAHLCHAWRDFRPKVDGLFRLRSWFQVPFMVMSATMTPYVRAYVHSSLRLPGHIPLIHRPIDRPEIYLSVKTIQHSLSTFQDLDFLLSPQIDPEDLIPTIVFADSHAEVSETGQGTTATQLN
jgi:superfamily II DNA helicase RecQ